MTTDANNSASSVQSRSHRLLTWKSGGIWIFLSSLLVFAVIVWQAILIFSVRIHSRAIGDGKDPATYEFDLTNLQVDRQLLVGSGLPRNGMRVMNDPATIEASLVAEMNRRNRYMVSGDLVIGVTIGGESRAYPLLVLNWHEIINDTLGGEPIVVSWHPWSGSAVVASRKVGEQILDFGFSGLVYNSTQLLYDRASPDAAPDAAAPPHVPSLWSPLLCRAISGPAAIGGLKLTPIDFALLPWSQWHALHPESRVLDNETPYKRNYKSADPYGVYRSVDQRLDYLPAISPLPAADGLPYKAPLLILRDANTGATSAHAISALSKRASDAGIVEVPAFDRTIQIRTIIDPPSAWLEQPIPGIASCVAYHFAWHALQPEAPIHIE